MDANWCLRTAAQDHRSTTRSTRRRLLDSLPHPVSHPRRLARPPAAAPRPCSADQHDFKQRIERRRVQHRSSGAASPHRRTLAEGERQDAPWHRRRPDFDGVGAGRRRRHPGPALREGHFLPVASGHHRRSDQQDRVVSAGTRANQRAFTPAHGNGSQHPRPCGDLLSVPGGREEFHELQAAARLGAWRQQRLGARWRAAVLHQDRA